MKIKILLLSIAFFGNIFATHPSPGTIELRFPDPLFISKDDNQIYVNVLIKTMFRSVEYLTYNVFDFLDDNFQVKDSLKWPGTVLGQSFKELPELCKELLCKELIEHERKEKRIENTPSLPDVETTQCSGCIIS